VLLEECQGSSNAGRRLEQALIERPCPLPEPARDLGARSRSCNADTAAGPPAGSAAAINPPPPLLRAGAPALPPVSHCYNFLFLCADVARQWRRLRPPHVSTCAALAPRRLRWPADPLARARCPLPGGALACSELPFFSFLLCPPAAPSSRPRAGCTRSSMHSRQPRATA
jgi:hypothetical protein